MIGRVLVARREKTGEDGKESAEGVNGRRSSEWTKCNIVFINIIFFSIIHHPSSIIRDSCHRG